MKYFNNKKIFFLKKRDCWAFYVVLWELFSKGKVPYPGLTNQEIVQCILNGQKLEPPPNCHYFIIELMQRCSDISPESRPTFAVCLKRFHFFY